MHYYIRFISDGGFRGRASRNDPYDERENSIDTRGAYTLDGSGRNEATGLGGAYLLGALNGGQTQAVSGW